MPLNKYRIGKIVIPSSNDLLPEEKIKEYLDVMSWTSLENAVINGHIWTKYLNSHDYKNVYLTDTQDSPPEIIKQILEQLAP